MPLKFFISCDMDGITGIVHPDQMFASGPMYAEGRRLMLHDVNAVIEGALREAADAEFLVVDGHGNMRNLDIAGLNPAAKYLCGPANWENRPLSQADGIDASFAAAFFVGYHSRVGTPKGLLAHTWAGRVIADLRINGKPEGETGMNAAILSTFGVPVGLVSGANDLHPETKRSLPSGFVFVETKQSLGRTAAVCLPPAKTRELLADGAAEAVRRVRSGKLKVGKYRLPVRMEIDAYRREMVDKALLVPGIERVSDRAFGVTALSCAEAASTLWRAACRAQDEDADWLK